MRQTCSRDPHKACLLLLTAMVFQAGRALPFLPCGRLRASAPLLRGGKTLTVFEVKVASRGALVFYCLERSGVPVHRCLYVQA